MVFIIQFGGAHLFLEIENSKKVLEYVFSTILMKFVLIFAISITVTKDVKVSLLSSILVSSILVLLINKKSNFCLLPNVCFQRVENFQDTKIQDKK
jgi:uncharacterized membrane protein YbjE (DUF340 family)